MKIEDIKITYGENALQKAGIEPNNNMIDYETSANLTYTSCIHIIKFANQIKPF